MSCEPSLRSKRMVMAAIIVCGYLLDQLTKYWAVETLENRPPYWLIDHLLSFQLFYNPGAAFSMGTQFTFFLALLSAAVLIGLLGYGVWKVRDWLSSIAIALLTFGVAGNLTDRLLRPPGFLQGYVVDFISLRGFAVFNVADIGITCAAILLVIWTFRRERYDRAEKSISSRENR